MISLAALADLPRAVPAVVRVRGRRGRVPRRGRRRDRAARDARRARPARRDAAASSRSKPPSERRLLGPPGRAGHAAPGPVRGRRQRWCSSCSRSRSSTSTSGLTDDRVVPDDMSSRAADRPDPRELREPGGRRAPGARCPNVDLAADTRRDRRASRTKLAVLPGVARVDAATGYYLPTERQGRRRAAAPTLSDRFAARPRARRARGSRSCPTSSRTSAAGEQLVKDIRATPAPFAFTVAGRRRTLVDTKESVLARAAAGRSGSSRSRPSCCCS